MKRALFLMLLLGNFLAFAKPVTVGFLKFAPPFSTAAENNTFFGFSVDLMDDICKRLQWDCVYKAAPLNQQLELLNDGSVDLIFTPTPISPDNNNRYLFSLPYLASNGQFLALADASVNGLDDIKNKKIGVLNESLYVALLDSNYSSTNQIKNFDLVSDLISALMNKDVDVVIINDSVARNIMNNNITQLKLVGDKIPMGEGYGIMALQKNADLIRKVNSALLQMESDGAYLKIYNTYFGNPM